MAHLPFKEWLPSSPTSPPGNTIRSSGDPLLSLQERVNRIRLFRSQNVGPVTYHNLLARFQTAQNAIDALPTLAAKGGRRKPLHIVAAETVEQEIERHHKMGAELIVEGDGTYPHRLSQIDGMPPVLSVRGRLDLLTQKSVAIVGARNCSLNGKKIASSLSKDLGAAGYAVVSGLARGIDAETHRAALATGTIAVIAGGIDKIYPPENEKLFHEIVETGLLIAESPLYTEPQSTLFPKRNRLISALSQGVIIIEAALQSGSLITARYAADHNKDVFVVPGSPMDPRYRGSNALIRNGAQLICCAADVIDVLEEPYRAMMNEAAHERWERTYQVTDAQTDTLSAKEGDALTLLILESLSPTPISLDDLLDACPYTSSDVMTVLIELELAGRITRHPGNQIST